LKRIIDDVAFESRWDSLMRIFSRQAPGILSFVPTGELGAPFVRERVHDTLVKHVGVLGSSTIRVDVRLFFG